MALQLGALRDALIEAGTSPEKASRAAEELALYERQFVDVRSDIHDLDVDMERRFADVKQQFAEVRAETNQHFADVKRQFSEARAETDRQFADVRLYTDRNLAEMRSEIRVLKWMGGATFAMATAIFLRSFIH